MSLSEKAQKSFKLNLISTEQRIEGRHFPGKRQEECGCFDNSELLKAMEIEERSLAKKK